MAASALCTRLKHRINKFEQNGRDLPRTAADLGISPRTMEKSVSEARSLRLLPEGLTADIPEAEFYLPRQDRVTKARAGRRIRTQEDQKKQIEAKAVHNLQAIQKRVDAWVACGHKVGTAAHKLGIAQSTLSESLNIAEDTGINPSGYTGKNKYPFRKYRKKKRKPRSRRRRTTLFSMRPNKRVKSSTTVFLPAFRPEKPDTRPEQLEEAAQALVNQFCLCVGDINRTRSSMGMNTARLKTLFQVALDAEISPSEHVVHSLKHLCPEESSAILKEYPQKIRSFLDQGRIPRPHAA